VTAIGSAKVTPTMLSQPLTLATAQNTTSGTSVDFSPANGNGIPSWAKRVTVMFNGVSTSGTSAYIIQLGDSGGIEDTGYVSKGMLVDNTGPAGTAGTSGFIIGSAGASTVIQAGVITLTRFDSGNTWIATGVFNRADAATAVALSAGTKTLSDTLDRIRLTTVNGTDTFDAGSVNIMYEG
jgi:hypothetical protein